MNLHEMLQKQAELATVFFWLLLSFALHHTIRGTTTDGFSEGQRHIFVCGRLDKRQREGVTNRQREQREECVDSVL